jgi:hypothetical protein
MINNIKDVIMAVIRVDQVKSVLNVDLEYVQNVNKKFSNH